jgi:hypothetical protein
MFNFAAGLIRPRYRLVRPLGRIVGRNIRNPQLRSHQSQDKCADDPERRIDSLLRREWRWHRHN